MATIAMDGKTPGAVELAEQVASGVYGDSLPTRWRLERDLAEYLLATGDRGGGIDLLALIVKQAKHRYFFFAYSELFAAARKCPNTVALATFAVLPTELFWDHGHSRGQAKVLRARGLFELGHYHAARIALRDPSIVEEFPAFVEECQATISALPGAVFEDSKRKAVPAWEGAAFWNPREEPSGEHQ